MIEGNIRDSGRCEIDKSERRNIAGSTTAFNATSLDGGIDQSFHAQDYGLAENCTRIATLMGSFDLLLPQVVALYFAVRKSLLKLLHRRLCDVCA
jgi:hypothetical protein